MMSSFGISRTVIREAVSALRADGLVVTRQGSGAFVAGDAGRRPFRIDPERLSSIYDVLQVMELRTGVEIETAGLAAQRYDRPQLRGVEIALEAIDHQIAAGDPTITADFEFHMAIAAATGNPYFVKFLEFLGNIIIPRQSVRIKAHCPNRQRAYLEKVQAEHREIYFAIRDRAVDDAREAVRRHLLNSRRRYQELAKRAESKD
jgi:GntR family transcriptional regulator, transcriptional repressor for pyruvate dehydrogenase complex